MWPHNGAIDKGSTLPGGFPVIGENFVKIALVSWRNLVLLTVCTWQKIQWVSLFCEIICLHAQWNKIFREKGKISNVVEIVGCWNIKNKLTQNFLWHFSLFLLQEFVNIICSYDFEPFFPMGYNTENLFLSTSVTPMAGRRPVLIIILKSLRAVDGKIEGDEKSIDKLIHHKLHTVLDWWFPEWMWEAEPREADDLE